MGYLYEMHCHTQTASRCASITPEQIVSLYKSKGYNGVVITDHFINGNTAVDRNQPWEKQMDDYYQGYLQVKKAAEGKDLDVLFGVELSYKGTDVLFYGADINWYKQHSEIMQMSMKEFILLARSHGIFTVQAHPFRRDWYIDHVRLFAEYTDGIEVYNSCRADVENDLADILANYYGLYKTAGSDTHVYNAERPLGGLELPERCSDINQVVDLIKSGKSKIVKLP